MININQKKYYILGSYSLKAHQTINDLVKYYSFHKN